MLTLLAAYDFCKSVKGWVLETYEMANIGLYGALKSGLITSSSSDVVNKDLRTVPANEADDISKQSDLQEKVVSRASLS